MWTLQTMPTWVRRTEFPNIPFQNSMLSHLLSCHPSLLILFIPPGLLFLGCVNALAYNLIHSLVIKVTSAVTTTVIGEMKIVLILVLSAVMLGMNAMILG